MPARQGRGSQQRPQIAPVVHVFTVPQPRLLHLHWPVACTAGRDALVDKVNQLADRHQQPETVATHTIFINLALQDHEQHVHAGPARYSQAAFHCWGSELH